MSRSRSYVRTLMLGAAVYAFGAVVPHGYAQVTTAITSDGTLATTVAQSGNLYNINGGTIKGTNQFHSFGQFSVGTGDIASFNGPANTTIQNILSRVTGGARSEIDGTLRSTISGANLYLLNPSGILFGPNAQLDVSGSFHATTADYIGLADGVRFNAVPSSADNLLTTAPPAAFGFLTSNPSPIDVQAGVLDFDFFTFTNILQVPVGQTLSFVGGPVNVGAAPEAPAGGFVFAPGGRINLVSVASPGEARFDGTGFSVDAFARLGDISITGSSVIDAKEVFIRGGRLVIEGALILPGFFVQFGAPFDPPNGGEVNIQTSDSVSITGPPSTFGLSGILTSAGNPSPGDVPHISIKSSSISLSDGALVQTIRQGPGNAGNLSIEADTVEVRSGAAVNVLNEFEGPGGTLTVNARDVTLDSAGAGSDQPTGLSAQAFFHPLYGQPDFETGSFATAFLPSLQFADSGSITVNATGKLTMLGSAQISTDNFAFGKSGNITINAGDMLLVGAGTNTGAIAAQSRLAGQAGGVTINATGSIDMQNGFRISANTLGSDDGGQVNVRAGRSITMTGTSTFISSVTDQPLDSGLDGFAQLFAPFFGVEILDYPSLRATLGVAPGTGDLMNVLAALSTISDGAGNPLVAITDFTPGNGGKVSITAPVLAVNDGAHIETSTLWDGNAGAIEVNVGSLTLRDAAIVGSRSGAVRLDRGFTVGIGNAGTVDIAATDTVEVSGRSPTSGEGSTVTTNTFGEGNAGNISLSANQVNIQSGGIVASASGGMVDDQLFVGAGNAGQISVSTPTLAMADGTISVATSGAGTAGSILLNGNTLSLTGGSQVLSSTTGSGQGGSVTATATESASFSGSGSGLFSTASSTGNAGEVSVSTPTLAMSDGGTISVATSGDGNAGNISLNVSNFTQTGGAQVVSSTTSAGQGGNLILTATESASFSGLGSGLFNTASSTGNAGEVTVSTPTLAMNNGAISVATSGAGNAGNISLNVANFTQTGGAQVVSSTTSAGQGGNLTLAATESASFSGLGSGLFSTAGATGAAGQITLSTPTLAMSDGGAISAATEGSGAAGNISLSVNSLNLATGAQVLSSTTGDGAGGTVAVTAGELVSISGAGTGLLSTASGTGNAGQITVTAPASAPVPTLTMADGGTISVATSGAGSAGSILLNANNFSLTGGAQVVSSTTGAGEGGSVTATAGESIFISGSGILPSGLFSTASSTGNAGQITVATPTLTMGESGTISVATEGTGNAGNIALNVSNLTQTGGAQVVSSTTGAGAGGNLTVTAANLIAVSGSGSEPSGLFSTASSTGNAGEVTVSTPTLTMGDGGTISVATSGAGNAGNVLLNVNNFSLTGGGQIVSSTSGAGQGGSVTANATNSASISGTGTGLFSTASGSGAGGNIHIQSGQLIQLADNATLSAQSTGTATATAGNITINTPTFETQNASVTTGATLADGGNISITTTGSLVHLSNSQITTSVQSGEGSGGNITIGSDLIVLDDSQVLANAFGGPGGNITITGDVFLVNSGGQSPISLAGIVEASSALSTPGTINIEAAVTDVSGTVAQLPEAPLQATELLRAACAARFVGGKTSSLVLGGRDGLPLQPGSLLPSPLYVASEADKPSTISSSTGFSPPTGFSLLGSSDRNLNRYSLLPNFKCSL